MVIIPRERWRFAASESARGALRAWRTSAPIVGVGLLALVACGSYLRVEHVRLARESRPVTAEPIAARAGTVEPLGARSALPQPSEHEVTAEEAIAAARRVAEAEDIELATAIDDAAEDTPMSDEAASVQLAQAWRALVGRPPSRNTLAVLWAHWAHETGRGRRMYGYNFGGLKGKAPDGGSSLIWTREASGPTKELVRRTFRAYPSPEVGARDYLALLESRYPSALRAARAGNVPWFVDALFEGRYFTDDAAVYRRAMVSLSIECIRRGLADRALAALESTAPQ